MRLLRKMRKNDPRLEIIWNGLIEVEGDASCTLDMDEPYRFAIRAILSAQCTDKRVNITCAELFEEVKTAREVLALGKEELSARIKPCGLHKSKAKSIMQMTELYLGKWQETIPNDVDELMSCPGIGRKIANLLVGELYGEPALVVDTHFKRVAKRLGLTKSGVPIVVERDVTKLYDSSKWIKLGHMVVSFGRDICTARVPKCDACPLSGMCPEGKKILREKIISKQKKDAAK